MDTLESTTELPKPIGNRCGHTRELPRFFARPEEHKRTYDVIHRASERLQEYYWQPIENWLPNLTYARDSTRQQRSERRESIVALTGAMLNALDMASFNIIKLFQGTAQPLSIKELAKTAGIGERRAERAIHDLKRAGYLELDYRYETLDTGEIKPLVAVKRFSSLFFYHLGITYEKLEKVRAFAQARLKKFNKKLQMAINEAKDTAQSFFNPALKGLYKPKRTYINKNVTTQDELLRWQTLRKEYPDWTAEQVMQAAKI